LVSLPIQAGACIKLVTNVTVLGAANGTVTIPITSAANAAVAQTALTGISMAVAAGTLMQVDPTGAGSLPSPATTAIGLLEQSDTSAPAPFVIGNGYVSAVLDGTASESVLTGVDPGEIVVSGAAGAMVGNSGFNTQVFFGGGNNFFVAIGSPVLDLAPTAQVYLDGNGYFDVSYGATTIFAGVGAAMNVANDGDASNTVNLEPGNETNTLVFSGSSTTAATVNAAGAGLSVVQDGGAGLINANDSNVTIYGVAESGDGSVTLFGGNGIDNVSNGSGLFRAGSGGGSLLVSNTAPGAATLIGGAAGDTLQALGGGDLMVAGSGNETLLGGQAPIIAIGFRGTAPAGAVTAVTGSASGGNVFFIGNGATSITGNHGDAGGNVYVELTNGPNTAEITDFVSAVDPSGAPVVDHDLISLAMPGGGDYQLDPGAGASVATNQVSYSYSSINGSIATIVQFGDGATWTLLNAELHSGDFA